MKALARMAEQYDFQGLLLVDFGDNDVSMYKDEHGIVHLEYVNGKLIIQGTNVAE
jgi:hypothetical protein